MVTTNQIERVKTIDKLSKLQIIVVFENVDKNQHDDEKIHVVHVDLYEMNRLV